MSHKATEQALASLLPMLEEIPDLLLRLADSLLAQSRSSGGTLKPEAEIARPYACAEIACARLKKSLELPDATSRPPCAPRVYKKLYNYLDQELSTKSTAGGKRQEKNEVAPRATRASARNNANAAPVTPSKTATKKLESSIKSLKRPRGGNANTTSFKTSTRIPDAPAWTMPLIRKICKALDPQVQRLTFTAPPDVSITFPPHIFAGLSSVLCLAIQEYSDKPEEFGYEHDELLATVWLEDAQTEDELYRQGVVTLMITIYFMVMVRMLHIEVDKDVGAVSVPGSRKITKSVINEMTMTALEVAGLEAKQTLMDDVDLWIQIVILSNWMHGHEWFENVPLLADDGVEEEECGFERGGDGETAELADDEDDVVSPKKRRLMNRYVAKATNHSSRNRDERPQLFPGLGTMMHDRVDWMSENKRSETKRWKERIVRWIADVERGAAPI